MKKIVFLLIMPLFSLYPADREYEIGNKFWPLAEMVNIEKKFDINSNISLTVRENEFSPDAKTILLMHFNENDEYDATGRSRASNLNISVDLKKLGKGGGLFNENSSSLVLNTEGRSFFPDRVYSGDFTVEFWLYSRNTKDGETYFIYENYTDTGTSTLPQLFRCYLEDRCVTWEIKNLFLPFEKSPFSLTLKGNKRIIPLKWSHHLLRYSSETGLLEYLFDGIPEAVAYVNREGKEGGSTYPFYAGDSSRIEMGKNFTGALDEFRIQGEWVENLSLSRIGYHSGYFITDIIDLKHSKSEIFDVDFRDIVPPGTDVKYYYYLTDSPSFPGADSSGWKQLVRGKGRLSGGRFLYIKGELFSDGEKKSSPAVNQIRLKYDEKSPPPPPRVVKAEALDKKIKLRWSSVPDSDIDGYLVYIGEKPGHYFGSETGSVASPVDAGLKNSLVIDNLDNSKIYYFTVCSYYKTASATGSIIKKGGSYSSEISARPSAGSR